LIINGAGSHATIIDGGAIERVLQIGTFNNGGQVVTIEGVTIRNGVADLNGGGGIFNNGDLTLSLSNVSDNSVDNDNGPGGGIFNNDTLNLVGVVLSGNTGGDGGAIFTEGDTTTVLDSSALLDNQAIDTGGGINNGGTLTITGSVVANNDASFNGGGILNNDSASITDTTLSGNTAGDQGGGVRNNQANATVTLVNATVVSNTATTGGSGLSNAGTTTATNTLISANTTDNCNGNTITSNGNNLEDRDDCGLNAVSDIVSVDPRLAPLVANDAMSPTLSHALLPGSPAIDRGDNATCVLDDAYDQRGAPRTRDGNGDGTATCDIGAFEWNPTYAVDSTADAVDADTGDDRCATAIGTCTLRAAIQQTNAVSGAEVILLPAGTYNLTLSGTGEDAAATGDLDIRDFVSIKGDGAARTIIDANQLDRVFDLRSIGAAVVAPVQRPGVRLEGVKARNGAADIGGGIRTNSNLELIESVVEDNSSDGNGGGIYAEGEANLLIERSTLRGNQAGGIGGAIYHAGNTGAVNITASTLNGNTASGSGGAMESNGKAVFLNSTVSGNTANSGGGLFLSGLSSLVQTTVAENSATGNNEPGGLFMIGRTLIAGSIVSANNSTSGVINCAFNPNASISAQWNVEDVDTCGFAANNDQVSSDPRLVPLAENGGPTQTHALLPRGSAEELQEECFLPTDQRGVPRPSDSDLDSSVGCESGAYERTQSIDLAVSIAATPNPVLAGANLTYTVTVSNAGPGVATNVTIEGVPPENVAFVSSTADQGNCEVTATRIRCPIGTVTAGANVSAEIAVSPVTAGTLTVAASVSASETDSDISNNTTNVNTTVEAAGNGGRGGSGSSSSAFGPFTLLLMIWALITCTVRSGSKRAFEICRTT